MIEAGDACIAFCESFDNLNDAQIVLLFLNGMLHSLFDVDQTTYISAASDLVTDSSQASRHGVD